MKHQNNEERMRRYKQQQKAIVERQNAYQRKREQMKRNEVKANKEKQ